MYMCIYVYICSLACVRMYIYVHTCIDIPTYIQTPDKYMYIDITVHTSNNMCRYVCVRMHSHTHTHTYMDTFSHTYVHACHVYMYACT